MESRSGQAGVLPTRNGGPQQPVASAVRNTASAQEPCSLRIPTNGMIRLMRILKKTDGMKPTSPARPFRWMGLPRELPFCSLPPAGVRNTTATTAKAARLKFPTTAGPSQKSFSGCRILAVPTITTMHLMKPYWLIWPILPGLRNW